MKIFYAYSSKNSDKRGIVHKEIIDYLKGLGHTVDEYCLVFSELIEPGSRDKNPSQIVVKIRDSDAFIGEMSRASQTLGFLLAFAVYHGKPSLYLYPTGSLGKPGKMITENPSRLLTVEEYSHTNFSDKISRFLKKVGKQLKASRTTFVSTREIDQYVTAVSKRAGLAKGEIIRDIMEKAIKQSGLI